MKNKILMFLCVLALLFSMAGCGNDEETTMTGIVVSVDGTVVSLYEFDAEGQEMPGREMSGMENGEGFDRENFNPENFDPENFDGSMPELPEGAERPEPPADGEMPADGERPDFSSRFSEEDSTPIDLANAHITVEFDGGKASGSMEDISSGSFLTVTMNEKGEATNVVVSSMPGFGRRNSAD